MTDANLCTDPISGSDVLIAPNRASRPQHVVQLQDDTVEANDPFLEGNEGQTPGETFAIRADASQPDGPGWHVRVVPNRYPALAGINACATEHDSANGVHEVIIECPQFETCISHLHDDHVTNVLQCYQHRLLQLRSTGLKHAVIFKNKGAAAGASLPHAHSQLMATNYVAPRVAAELNNAESLFDETRVCPFESLLQRELAHRKRIIHADDQLVVLCPEASRFAYETWLIPRQPQSHFELDETTNLAAIARALKATISALHRVRNNPAYNYVLHTAPFDSERVSWYRWHIEIMPRFTGLAGSELGAGVFINTVEPEVAAKLLS